MAPVILLPGAGACHHRKLHHHGPCMLVTFTKLPLLFVVKEIQSQKKINLNALET
jgi:hypothetical protein